MRRHHLPLPLYLLYVVYEHRVCSGSRRTATAISHFPSPVASPSLVDRSPHHLAFVSVGCAVYLHLAVAWTSVVSGAMVARTLFEE